MERALELLQAGKPARVMLQGIAAEELRILQGLNLLTAKPVLYVCNVAEKDAAPATSIRARSRRWRPAQGAAHRRHLRRDRGRGRAAAR